MSSKHTRGNLRWPETELSLNEILPPDWADILQQGEVNVGGLWVTFLDYPTDFFGLPINNARHNNCEAITGIELSVQIGSESGCDSKDYQ